MTYTLLVTTPLATMPGITLGAAELRGVISAVPDYADLRLFGARGLVSEGKQPQVLQELLMALKQGGWMVEGGFIPL